MTVAKGDHRAMWFLGHQLPSHALQALLFAPIAVELIVGQVAVAVDTEYDREVRNQLLPLLVAALPGRNLKAKTLQHGLGLELGGSQRLPIREATSTYGIGAALVVVLPFGQAIAVAGLEQSIPSRIHAHDWRDCG